MAIHPFNWGAAFIDLENSGTQDLITVGKLPILVAPASVNPGTVYRNDGSFPWTLLDPLDVGVDSGTGLSVGDFDNDGLEDVVVQNFGPTVPPANATQSVAVFLHNRNKDPGVGKHSPNPSCCHTFSFPRLCPTLPTMYITPDI